MQFPADLPPLVFLRRENLAVQPPQLFLQAIRSFEQLAVVALAFLERFLHGLAMGDLLAQFQIQGGQLHRALA